MKGPTIIESIAGRQGARGVYVAIGIAALMIGLHWSTYLPFLGEASIPCSVLADRTPEHADTAVTVSGLTPGAKVLYWAAEPATDGLARIKDWRQAYMDYANAGVTTVGTDGVVTMNLRRPQPYLVPVRGAMPAHVRWRMCGDGGMMGPVQMTALDGGAV